MKTGGRELLEKLRRDARDIFDAGVAAVEPGACVRRYCRCRGNRLQLGALGVDLDGIERIFVVGAGKASAAMAVAVEEILGDRITGGILNVKYGHSADLVRIDLVEAGHPVPDDNGVAGAGRMLQTVASAGERDLVIGLFSGGGSALLPLPAEGITLDHKQAVTRVLLACGATIHEINSLRKHLSAIKGGRLSRAAWPAPVVALCLSDVVGDDLDVIASGPTVPDASTYADCLAIIARYGIEADLPAPVVERLQRGAAGGLPESPKACGEIFSKTTNLIVGSNSQAIRAARTAAEKRGYGTLILSSLIEGETREVAKVHAAIARESLASGHPLHPPACILSGGETTVTLMGDGRGGRNQEFVLATALEIDGCGPLVILSAGTDGSDGPTDAAGALADGYTLARARDLGMDPAEFLRNNDSYPFFKRLNDLVVTGPTRTNVMDLRVMLLG